MPNWCWNDLVVQGEPEEVKEVIEFVRSEDRPFDFERVIPIPEEVSGNPDGMVGYNWRIDNWGTKWNVSGVECGVSEYDGGVHYSFETAWAPPVEVVGRLSEMFPELTVALAYDEPGMGFGGFIVFRGGSRDEEVSGGSRMNPWIEIMEGWL
jgi:hypothetical protein